MCTLTFVPTEDGYVAGMNRDEKRARPPAFFPQRFEFPGSDAIYPHEASGGTWIACNTYGNLLALLNWNDVRLHSMPAGQLSRGALIPELLPAANDLAHVSERYGQLDLAKFMPFRLIGFFFQESVINEWRWGGLLRHELQFAWQKMHWFSSSISDALARRNRGRTCARAAKQSSAEPVSSVRSLHASHDPSPGPFSVCVHRKDAVTVSYTEVSCNGTEISMAYRHGSPCLANSFDSEMSLARRFPCPSSDG